MRFTPIDLPSPLPSNAAMEGFAWRIEAACRAAWPPVRTATVDGWILGLADSVTRRATSANPLSAAARTDPATIARIDAAFAAAGRPTLFRIPTLLPSAGVALDTAGFAPGEATTQTLAMPLDAHAAATRDGAIVEPQAAPAWIAARERLSGTRGVAATLACIEAPTIFARIERDGAVQALGYAAIVDGIAVLEAIATDPAARRQGLATRIVAALLAQARDGGARDAALQVMADNAAAIALYRRTGFDRHLYDYHYRRRPA